MNTPDPTSSADAQAEAIASAQRGGRNWAVWFGGAVFFWLVFDRRTTVNLWTRPLCLLIGGVVAAVCATYFLSLRSRSHLTGEMAGAGRTAGWLLGLGVTALVSGAVGVSLCGVVAQHLTGTPAVVEATVSQYSPLGQSRGCYRSATLAWASDQSSSFICLKGGWSSIPAGTLHVGDAVSVHLIRTPLGDVIQRIDVDTADPAQ